MLPWYRHTVVFSHDKSAILFNLTVQPNKQDQLQANNNQTIANSWIRGYTRMDTALLSCQIEISSRHEQTSDTLVLLDTVWSIL